MEQTTRNKAVSGMFWTGLERLGTQLIQFVIGILIARILLPSDYGLLGMLAIFMGIAQTFIDSGFANALIQKKDRNQKDFSTVFYFSIGVGFLIYILLFFSAPYIAKFYRQPILTNVARVYMLTLIINSLSISQTAKLTIDLNFRIQAIISIISIFISGFVGIVLAYGGYGVWALVWQGISSACVRTTMIWISSKWMPLISFSKESFRRLFSFGSKLLASSLINNIYGNISTLIIGKAFNSSNLGFFTRAQQFCQLPTQTITNIVVKVNYPILSQLQDDNDKLVTAYKSLLRTPVFILYPILFGLSVLSEPLIMVLLGEKWVTSAFLIPILCFGCLWDPLTHINLNLLYVKGKTDLVLKLELIKKPIAFIMLFCAIPLGLKGMCCAISLYSLVAFIFNCHYTGKILNFGFFKQVKSLLPIIMNGIVMSIGIIIVNILIENSLPKLIYGFLTGVVLYFGFAIATKDPSLKQVKNILSRG